MKTQIYAVTDFLNTSTNSKVFRKVLEYKINPRELPHDDFSKHPYRWALKAANGHEGIKLRRDQIYGWSRELEYAAKHRVPPEFLVGFIYQVGGTAAIIRKLKAGTFETWSTAEGRMLEAFAPRSCHRMEVVARLMERDENG